MPITGLNVLNTFHHTSKADRWIEVKRRRWVWIGEKSKARTVVENGEGVVVGMPIGSDLARTCAFAYTCGVACGAPRVANRLANPPGGAL